MEYKYEKVDQDYSDLASGRVFYSLAGHPAFPIRLASEIFQRCLTYRETIYGATNPCTLYDPCCGAAYHLSVLSYLHRRHIQEIIASDIDEKAIALAERNLGLLNVAGLNLRIGEITTMIEQYGKDSHRDALKSAHLLRDGIATSDKENPLSTEVFRSNAADRQTILKHIQPQSVDIIFTDVPYGQHSQWQDSDEIENPLWSMLEALTDILSPSSIVAVASDKGQKVSHERYQRVERFQLGKRRVVILRPVKSPMI
jgi:16S rRNA G966 N2-methylase RsmD